MPRLARRRRIHAGTRGSSRRQTFSAVDTFAHLPPSIEVDRPCVWPGDGSGCFSRVIQRDRHVGLLAALAITAAPHSRRSHSRFSGLQRRKSAKSRSRSRKGRRARRRCPTSETRSRAEQIVGSLSRVIPRQLRPPHSRILLRLARARHLAFVGRADHPARQFHRTLDHMLRRFTRIVKGMVVYRRSHAREPRPQRGVGFRARLPS